MGHLRRQSDDAVRLHGKIAWVTGAATAALFREEGARVFAMDLADCDVADRAAVGATVACDLRDAGHFPDVSQAD